MPTGIREVELDYMGDGKVLSREEVWSLREFLPEEAKRWVEEFERECEELLAHEAKNEERRGIERLHRR